LARVVLRHRQGLLPTAAILFSQQLLLLAAERVAATDHLLVVALVVQAVELVEIYRGRVALVTRRQPHQVKVVMAAQHL